MLPTILTALIGNLPVTITYRAANGMVSLRTIRPAAVARCANGNTIVRAFDTHRNEPRSFSVSRVLDAALGSLV